MRRLPARPALALVVVIAVVVAALATVRRSSDASPTDTRRPAAEALSCATPGHPRDDGPLLRQVPGRLHEGRGPRRPCPAQPRHDHAARHSGAVLGCVACIQQAAGSGFLATLNAADGTPPPVDYTVVETSYDLVVTPYESAFLRGPATRITNVVLQDAYPGDLAGDLTITSDPVAVQWVQDALARNGPADPRFRPRC